MRSSHLNSAACAAPPTADPDDGDRQRRNPISDADDDLYRTRSSTAAQHLLCRIVAGVPSRESREWAATRLSNGPAAGSVSAASVGAHSPIRRRQIAIVLVLILAIIVGFLLVRGAGLLAGGAKGTAAFEHVHGIGFNPADNTLYAATHDGLYRLPTAGPPVRVADRVQDFMGFTVVGPDHFLASGHPGEGSSGPSSLGLIESTDRGNTWTSLSLAGKADFHALQARHGTIYGYNSMTGAFLVSANGNTWQTRTTLAMADFAVSPRDADVVVAATEQGLVRSSDGGRSFAAMAAPLLLLISWAEDGTLVGLTPKGVVHVSTDQGITWHQRGTIRESPEALEAANADEIYAAAAGRVLASRNGGRTFAPLAHG